MNITDSSSSPKVRNNQQRLKTRMADIKSYSKVVTISTLLYILLIAVCYGPDSTTTMISGATSGIYVLNFWLSINARRDFENGKWKSILGFTQDSKNSVPRHVKLVTMFVLVVQVGGILWTNCTITWLFTSVLHLSSFYFFYSSDFIKYFQ